MAIIADTTPSRSAATGRQPLSRMTRGCRLAPLAVPSRSLRSQPFERGSGLTEKLNTGFHQVFRHLLHDLLQKLLPAGDHIQEKALPLRRQEHLLLTARVRVFYHLHET